MACIYQITSKVSPKKYIGSAYNFERRKYQHIWSLSNQTHSNIHLQNHYNLYKDDLVFEILQDDISNDVLYDVEQLYLDELFNSTDKHCIFNISPSSKNATVTGWKHTQEWKERQSERQLGFKHSDDTKEKMSNILKERWNNNIEYRNKLSDSAKKRPSNRKGIKLSEETKLKISMAKKGTSYEKTNKWCKKTEKW